jgi:iron complex outermembrane recepter protein
VTYFNVRNGEELLDTSKTNHFKYEEDIHAGYAIFSKEWKKVTLQLGLRGEQTITKGYQQANDSSFTRSYFQLFPTASLSFVPSQKHQWGLSYSRRIDRPDYQDMNPFRFFLDQYTYEQGNPFLKPQFSNNFELSYTFMQIFSGVFSYSRTLDIITDITRQNDLTHVTYVNKENLDLNDNYSFTLSLPAHIGKWLTSNNSINGFYNHFNSVFEGSALKEGALTYVLTSSNQIQLKNNFSMQVDFNYTSPMVYAIFHIQPLYGLSLAIQKKVFHERGKIKLAFQNIVRNKYMVANVKFQNMDFDFKQQRDNRFVNISFTYKFGKNTIASSRKHSTGADDEKNRVKKG